MPTRDRSLAELALAFEAGTLPATPTTIRALLADERAGARALAGRLARRRSGDQTQARRLARLLRDERGLRRVGVVRIAGVDEVGVGPLAGPVIAAAVLFDRDVPLLGVDDSKRLSEGERERLAAAIVARAAAVAIGSASPAEIDAVNVYQAGLLAMRRAVLALAQEPEHLLVDARHIPGLAISQTALIGGDGRSFAIAAASIVAKVHRDALMVELDRRHPGYGLARHKGYPTAEHLAALARLGPTTEHRRSFAPVREVIGPSRGGQRSG